MSSRCQEPVINSLDGPGKALDAPWHIAGDDDRNGRRVIIYREMFSGRMRIVAIDKRMTRDADNHVTIGTGSIIGTAEVNDN